MAMRKMKKIKIITKKQKQELLGKINSRVKFERWKKEWYETVPKCKDFTCVHDLMSCGISIICGDCSIYETFKRGNWYYVCQTVSCMDCTKRYTCKRAQKFNPKQQI